MSVEIIEAQEQLQRARDNLRHVEEGIKKTATSSNLRLVLYTYVHIVQCTYCINMDT